MIQNKKGDVEVFPPLMPCLAIAAIATPGWGAQAGTCYI